MTLPSSWRLVALEQVLEGIAYGYTASASWDGVGPKFLRITDLSSDGVNWDSVPQCECEDLKRFGLKAGDIVVARTGATTGKSYLIRELPEPAVFASYLIRLNTFSALPAEYLAYFLQSPGYWRQITSLSKGTAQPGANASILGKLQVPLAPVNEQRRIVAKLDELFARSRAAREALDAIPPLLERFRQSVLGAAFRGELTAEWRRQNPAVEPASVLLQKVNAARSSRWSNTGERSDSDVLAFRGLSLPSLPTGWTWAQLQDLAGLESNAICAGPFGTIFKAKDFRDDGVPIIFLRHVQPWNYRHDYKPGFMDRAKWEELFQPYSVYGGELLVTKLGEPPGVCAIYPEGLGPAMVTPDVIKMSVLPEVTSNRYLMNYLNSDQARRLAFGAAYGATRLRMNLPIFRHLPVPLPPVLEQHQLVAAMDDCWSSLARFSENLSLSTGALSRLTTSCLNSAFRGQLVPQDPSDEPASALLDRVRAEGAGQSIPARRRRSPT